MARLALDAGKPEEALRHVRAGFAYGRQQTGGCLIEGLVAVVCDGIAVEALEDLLCLARLDAAQLTALGEFLDTCRATLDPGVDVMKGEELLSLQTVDMLLSGKLGGAEFMTGLKFPEEVTDLLSSRAARIVLPDRTMRAHLTMVYAATREGMRRPYWETHRDGEALADPVAAIPPWDFMARLLLPAMARTGATYAKRSAQFDLARTAVALKLALLDTGVRPAKLADLVPKYLKEVPVDPFTGKPLGYILAPDGWRVYSVGPDQIDNHGVRTQLPNGEYDMTFYLEDAPGRRPKPNAPPPPPTEKPPVPEPPPTTPEEF
jgi:hypothetical protein